MGSALLWCFVTRRHAQAMACPCQVWQHRCGTPQKRPKGWHAVSPSEIAPASPKAPTAGTIPSPIHSLAPHASLQASSQQQINQRFSMLNHYCPVNL